MMALVFLTPIVSIFVIAMLIYQWNNGDPAWHPYLATLYGVFGLVLVLLTVRHILRENAGIRPSRVMNEDCVWQAGTTVDLYRAQAAAFLRAHGWRVTSAAAGRDRVEIVIRKDRWTVALLILQPGQQAFSAEDVARLAAIGHEAGAGRRAVVSTGNPHANSAGLLAPASLTELRFEDLPRLEDALGLWS